MFYLLFIYAGNDDNDDDEVEDTSGRKRSRKESGVVVEKREKKDSHAKLKRKTRGHVEVKLLHFYLFIGFGTPKFWP